MLFAQHRKGDKMQSYFEEWHWEVTRRCNLKCAHCITGCGSDFPGELSADQAFLAIDKMAESGCKRVFITGGEPLVRKDIFAILDACKSKGMELGLLTNGFTVNRYIVSRLSPVLSVVGFSLDGATARIHDAIRGNGSFDKACRAISTFSKKLPVYVYTTVSCNNFSEIREIIRKALELGARYVHVSEVSIFGRAQRNSPRLALDLCQKKSLRRLAERLAVKKDFSCQVDLSTVYLSYNGFVYPCSEVAIKKPDKFLVNVVSGSCVRDLALAQERWITPQVLCCYAIYKSGNVVFCLDSGKPCCAILKGGQA
jgi:MoaA/NifB/PqqE/SkfB family radical SAM enzyme